MFLTERTPAARMKKVPSTVVKKRSRELTSAFEAFAPYVGMEGRVERIWITDIATDGIHLVGHTKGYVQVLVAAPESMLGTSAIAKITSVGRWSVFGEVIETIPHINDKTASTNETRSQEKCFPGANNCETCACSTEPETCACGPESCGGQATSGECAVTKNVVLLEDRNNRNLLGWLLRKRKNQVEKRVENEIGLGSQKKQEQAQGRLGEWGFVDRVLLGGMLVSFLTIVTLLVHLGFRIPSSN
ncbi:hypothetical protein ACFX15_019432 [Malus domestica]|uniref:TRAM domain-containing protein n=1 Tax=Malus domestica TaxID=3750 RepID=A0A498HUN8_MALDO|nr:hypothetical protein DVH24_016524 [Malus domestica]